VRSIHPKFARTGPVPLMFPWRQILLGLVCGLVLIGNAPAAQGEATALVRDSSERMLKALESRRAEITRNPKAIFPLVESIVLPHFDFEKITQIAVGKAWGDATGKQQRDLIAEFREVLIRTYAKSLLNYSGQAIRYLPEQPGKQPSTVTVSTEVREAGGQTFPIDYRLYEKGGRYKVYDVVVDRVSLVSNYRSSFAAQIRQGGIDGLIGRLKQMNTKGEG